FAKIETPSVPILFAVSPLEAIRSAPTIIASILPWDKTVASILSVITVTSIPADCNSNAVNIDPCNLGLVSFEYTLISQPFSWAKYIGDVAVLYFVVASALALQCFNKPIQYFNSGNKFSQIFKLVSSSSA